MSTPSSIDTKSLEILLRELLDRLNELKSYKTKSSPKSKQLEARLIDAIADLHIRNRAHDH